MNKPSPVQAVRDYQSQCNGTESIYRYRGSALFFYSDGVRFVAEQCGARWLVDAIMSHQITPSVRHEPFQVWWLVDAASDGESAAASLVATDGGKGDADPRVLATQRIPYTDFPRELMPFRLCLEAGILLLPEER